MPTTLTAGDIAIIGYNADGTTKPFSFVFLRNVDAGTQISFTDNGWQSAGGFRANEGTISYTTSGAVTAGTVVTLNISGNFNPSGSGDQILAYQGTAASPTFIYAIDFADNNTTFAGNAADSNTSALPPGLTLGQTAVGFGLDNGRYSGSTSGTPAELRAAISNPANWTGSDTTNVTVPTTPFTVSTGPVNPTGPSIVSLTVDDASRPEGEAFTFTVTLSAPAEGNTVVTLAGSGSTGDTAGVPASVTVLNGQTTATFTVASTEDAAAEANETFTVAATLNGVTRSVTATIEDDDAPVAAPTLISAIQGTGAASTYVGQTVTVEAIVVGDFQNGDADNGRNLNGFYLQEEITDSDGNVMTSEAVFIFGGSGDVNVGDRVRVTGTVSEYFGQTQINATGITVVQADAVADVNTMAAEILLPVAGVTTSQEGYYQPDLEAYESMLVSFPQKLVITEQFDLDRFNEMKLYAPEGDGLAGAVDEGVDGRPYQYTQTNDPDAAGYLAHNQAVGGRTITYDDGLNVQNTPIENLDGLDEDDDGVGYAPGTEPGYNTGNATQMGDSVTNLTGVLDYQWGGEASSGSTWRVRAVENGANEFVRTDNPREAEPADVGGSLKVGSFNVLNFFVTLDNNSNLVDGTSEQPRGANNTTELSRQTEKLLTSLVALDADVLGLVELENDFSAAVGGNFATAGNAIGYLVQQLNARLGGDVYSYVYPGYDTLGTDAIAVGFIYKNDVVRIADGTSPAVDFDGINDRPTVAVTFTEIASNESFTAVVNHFKSKGSASDSSPGNQDSGDGQALSNEQRVEQAARLADWLDTNPTGATDPDYLLLGDFNSYFYEDPMVELRGSGYQSVNQATDYSYVFDGRIGSLDQALASGSLGDQIAGSTTWHINSDEPDALDYNTDFTRDQDYFDGTVPYRVSDHDPILIGLDLDSVGPVLASASPADNAGNVARGANIVLTFDEAVRAGTGTITLTNGAGDVRQIAVTDPQVTFSGNTVTINPTTDLAYGASYDVIVPTGAITDATGNAFAGIAQNGLDFSVENAPAANFTLQILHASDFEAGLDAVDRAGNFAAIVDYLEETRANSITLSSGDNFLPSPFFNAGSDAALKEVYETALEDYYNLAPGSLNISPGFGTADISMLNIIGVEASAMGNHEFDAGTNPLAAIIRQTAGYPGAQFPYLAANLDFSGDANLRGLYTNQIRNAEDYTGFPPAAGIGIKIAPAAIINEGGERIGIVGATTQIVQTISSTGGVEVIGPNADDMAALAAVLQPTIDALLAQGINKIILVSHLQQLALEKALAPLLHGVDVIVAGGSHTLLADSEDVGRGLQPGDTPGGEYPFVTQNADGKTTVIVNTDNEYSYVGRLVVDFDANGDIVAGSIDPNVSGAYATTDEGVADLYETPIDIDGDGDLDSDPFVSGSRGDLVNDIASAVGAIIDQQDGNIFGRTDVYLEGRRGEVRTEETNLGNLSSDANLWYAQQLDETVLVSIKNGGGVRDSIGRVEATGGSSVELPPSGNPDVGKEEGEISQLDIANSLRFNNALSLVTLTPQQLLEVLEHAVRATAPGATPGQFAQIGGIAYSYDDDLPAGQRVVSAALIDENGDPRTVLVRDGEVVADAPAAIRLVTLSFLLTGGDGYPFQSFIAANPSFANVVNLDAGTGVDNAAGRTGDATFVDEGTEQDALAEYLSEFFSDTPYSVADTAPAGDTRIQNLDVRADTVLDDSNSNTISFRVAQDEYLGNAQFVLTVNGQQVGGPVTVTTDHDTGNYQTVTFSNVVAEDIDTVGIRFINDRSGGTPDTDRNLYVDSMTLNGIRYEAENATNPAGPTTSSEAILAINGEVTFQTGPSLTLRVSQDAYQGNAEFVVLVDGQQVGGRYSTTASHAAGEWQDITIRGNFDADPDNVSVRFVNDASGGTAATDRNLYVDSLTIDGQTYEAENGSSSTALIRPAEAALVINGDLTFDTRDLLTVRVAEDAYQGDAKFIVRVDGQQVGGVYTATASHAAGEYDDLSIQGNFGPNASNISIEFFNDRSGGTPATDRNLYVDSLTYNGQVYEAEDATNNAGPTTDMEAIMARNGTLVFDTGLLV